MNKTIFQEAEYKFLPETGYSKAQERSWVLSYPYDGNVVENELDKYKKSYHDEGLGAALYLKGTRTIRNVRYSVWNLILFYMLHLSYCINLGNYLWFYEEELQWIKFHTLFFF